ncbi:hypothetical protein HPP92_014080 [Vanilla planifolia]|uniref:POX domain-containing protein n=1 Tax=Vanilla planifolia TaxID=51239 RepID=A0A835QMV8_VANPL|nr:hypothetical protein HPP92_014521 [Vanilla planifolia]KAG0474394.1 hypothetical protein HPP92_014080 [Vanilla planifolia]
MAHDSYQPAIFAFSGHGQQLESFISITEPEGWVDQPRHLLQVDATMRSFFPASPDVEEHRSHGLSLSFRSNSFQSEKFFPESDAPARSAVTEYGSQLGRLVACKYLTPAQQLLNELCNLRGEDLGVRSKQNSLLKKREKGGGTSHLSSALSYNFLQSLDILELQRRKAKLMVLLEEVDRRYKRYCEQMRAVVWPFEAEAGCGAAELYLCDGVEGDIGSLRRLKDGILAQMQGLKKAMEINAQLPPEERRRG